MPKQGGVGPIKFPWGKGQLDEIFVFMFAGLLGAIVGATILHHYRCAKKKV